MADDSEDIGNFCAITAAEPEIAKQYLQVSDGNIEAAISLYYQNDGAPFTHTAATPSSGTNAGVGGGDNQDLDDEALANQLQNELNSAPVEPEVRERIQPVTETLVEPGYTSYPSSARGSRRNLNRPFSVFDQLRGVGTSEDPMSIDDDSEEEALPQLTEKQNRLANLFRPPFDLIRDVDLQEARDIAREEKKWIMVNLQDTHDFQCQLLNRDFWSDKQVKDIVSENFVFLQYMTDSVDGEQYQQYYSVSSYPHISILDPRTGEQLKTWSKIPEVPTWIMEVMDFLDSYSLEKAKNPISKLPKHKTDVNHMTEEEQLNYAVQESLGGEEEEEKGTKQGEPSTSKGKEPLQEEEHETPLLEPSETAAEFDSIPAISRPEPKDPKTSTRLQIRLADGTRFIRRFNLTDPVWYIYEFIKADVPQIPSNVRFHLTSERRKLLELKDETIEDAGLRNSVILVETD